MATLEQAVRDSIWRPAPLVPARSVIERYLLDLQATFSTSMDEVRRMLRLSLAKIVLRRDGQYLVAEITGDYTSILNLGEYVRSIGAGSSFRTLFTRTPGRLTVA